MNKDFSINKLLSFSTNKQIQVLFDLARFIEKKGFNEQSSHFDKLKKYHSFLEFSNDEYIQKLNKEFSKVKSMNRQFHIYMMNLERFVGQSTKEYDFLMKKSDESSVKKKFPIICILDSVRSAHNVGAFLRNAECFGVEKVFMTGLSPKGDHPQVIKTAMGCDSLVEWEYREDALELIRDLKSKAFHVVSIDTTKNSSKLEDICFEKIVLLFGHEQFGLSLDLLKISESSLSIELYGQKNSLNVAVSSGIILKGLTDKLNHSK